MPLDLSNTAEMALRRPVNWLGSVESPLFILEGADGRVSNVAHLRVLEKANTNPQIHFVAIHGADHFSDLAPANRAIAAKILTDTGSTTTLTINEDDVKAK